MSSRSGVRWAVLPLLVGWSCAALAVDEGSSSGPSPAPAPPSVRPGASESGLPVPRYVSLKADRVNLRTGPGTEYPTAWVFRRAGMPVEVLAEFEGWRQVRDAEGTTGWVVQSLLSGRRTGLVVSWDTKAGAPAAPVAIRNSDSESARTVANVEVGVIANVQSCDGRWCQVNIDKFHGYIQQKRLWGIYESEVVK